jgi:hypothetical protein
VLLVSILARPSRAGRPDPCDVWRLLWSGFNPRSALTGRASNYAHHPLLHRSRFNPRSALTGRASSTNGSRLNPVVTFQSSLGPHGPGVLADHVADVDNHGGVSILARPSRAGRQRAPVDSRPSSFDVSILARPSRAGRLLRSLNPGLILSRRFNPRSALTGRASSVSHPLPVAIQQVSILARPSRAGRRRRVSTCCASAGSALIRDHVASTPGQQFNPRSALTGRASCFCAASAAYDIGFNPRSALTGRASRCIRAAADQFCVSILARPSRAGRQVGERDGGGCCGVSILARPSRAGRHVHWRQRLIKAWFQSSLGPSRAGRRQSYQCSLLLFAFQSSLGPHGPGVTPTPDEASVLA